MVKYLTPYSTEIIRHFETHRKLVEKIGKIST